MKDFYMLRIGRVRVWQILVAAIVGAIFTIASSFSAIAEQKRLTLAAYSNNVAIFGTPHTSPASGTDNGAGSATGSTSLGVATLNDPDTIARVAELEAIKGDLLRANRLFSLTVLALSIALLSAIIYREVKREGGAFNNPPSPGLAAVDPRTSQNRPRTGQNYPRTTPEPAQNRPRTTPELDGEPAQNWGGSAYRGLNVLAREQGGLTAAAGGGDRGPVTVATFPIRPPRPLTEAEREIVEAWLDEGNSRNSIVQRVYGVKNGTTWGLLFDSQDA